MIETNGNDIARSPLQRMIYGIWKQYFPDRLADMTPEQVARAIEVAEHRVKTDIAEAVAAAQSGLPVDTWMQTLDRVREAHAQALELHLARLADTDPTTFVEVTQDNGDFRG